MRFYIIILILLLFSCDTVSVNSEDVKKYSEIKPFVLNDRDFQGTHDLDLGILEFSYIIDTANAYALNKIDSVAINNEWNVNKISTYKRNYVKNIKAYPADNEQDTLYFEYDKTRNRLNFKWY